MQKNPKLYLSTDKIVRATAGAGKTTALITDVYETYKSHKKNFNKSPRILLTTFTVKAANELSERLIKKAEEIEDKEFLSFCLSSYLEIGTMHSVFSTILIEFDQNLSNSKYVSQAYKVNCAKGFFVQFIKEQGLISHFSEPYTFNETLKFFMFLERSNFSFNTFDKKQLFESYKKELLVQVERDSAAYEAVVSSASFLENKNILSLLDPKEDKNIYKFIEQEYNQDAFINNFVEFNSILKKLYLAWKAKFSNFVSQNGLYTLEDMEALLLKYSSDIKVKTKWDYCFLDEYQDTSPEQKKLIDRFCNESIKYFVGDPFQSIYFFRGARKEIFDNEFSRIESQTQNVEYKTNSYRSAINIVNFVNHLSAKVFKDFDPMKPIKQIEGGVEVAYFENESVDTEIEYLISKVKDLDPKDVLILSKQTKNLSKAFKKMKASGLSALPLYAKGVSDYIDSFELVNLLLFLADEQNEDALLVLIFSKIFALTEKETHDLIQKSKSEDCSLWSIVSKKEEFELIKHIKEQFYSYSLSLKFFITNSKFLLSDNTGDDSHFKEFNSLKILRALESEEQKPGFNIKAFCEDILNDRYAFGKESIESSGSFKLMTVHGSKGLEAKHVFILGANQGYRDLDNYPFYFDEKTQFCGGKVKDSKHNRSFPSLFQSLIGQERLVKKEENRRLFYVALTRAEDSLTILGSGKREKSPSEPSWMSHVLKEIEKGDLDMVNLITNDSVLSQSAELNTRRVEESSVFNFLKMSKGLDFNVQNSSIESSFDSGDVYRLSMNIKRGINFHAFMEGSESLADNAYYGEAMAYLTEQTEFPFTKIISQGHKEWGYDWLNPDTNSIESGKIDIWAHVEDTVWIVDYKTGSFSGVESGFEQLGRYRDVLSAMNTKFKNFKLVLTFPFDKKTYIRS